MEYNARGEELPDDTPIDLPLRFKRPPTMQDQIKAMVRHELSVRAQAVGMESFAEADDFEVDDDAEPVSPHELTLMQEEFRYANPDQKVLDKGKGKEYDDGTVNKDRVKENDNVGAGVLERGKISDRGIVDGVRGEDGKGASEGAK